MPLHSALRGLHTLHDWLQDKYVAFGVRFIVIECIQTRLREIVGIIMLLERVEFVGYAHILLYRQSWSRNMDYIAVIICKYSRKPISGNVPYNMVYNTGIGGTERKRRPLLRLNGSTKWKSISTLFYRLKIWAHIECKILFKTASVHVGIRSRHISKQMSVRPTRISESFNMLFITIQPFFYILLFRIYEDTR